MKFKFLYLSAVCILFISNAAPAQLFNLSQANGICFNGNLFVFGLREQSNTSHLLIYKLNQKAAKLDSFQLHLGNLKASAYLQLSADSLHDFLNVYVQQKNAKEAQIIRFDKNFQFIANIEKTDIARLNNSALFSSGKLYFNKDVYTVKVISDTGGKQFYINKYQLKSTNENFDYSLQWQFPFERKNVEEAHLFYVDKNVLMLYVYVSKGIKKGQWVLKLHGNSGELIKATKLNSLNEASTLVYGLHHFDKNKKSIHVFGQEFNASQLDFETSLFQITDATHAELFHLELDSIGNLIQKQSFKLPIQLVSSGSKRSKSSVLMKLLSVQQTDLGDFTFETDIYKNNQGEKCFLYANSLFLQLKKTEDQYQAGKTVISNNKLIEDYYYSADKNDLNGKICLDSVAFLPKFYSSQPNFPVKLKFKLDSTANPCWILNKHTFHKNNVNTSVLHPVNKIYKLETYSDILENKSPRIIFISDEKLITFQQKDENLVEINLFNW